MDKHVNEKSNKYLAINDQTFDLLKALKENDQDEYYKAIHTSHFTAVLALETGADMYLCKGAGYYYNIAALKSNTSDKDEDDASFMEKHMFPKELIEFILCLNQDDVNITSKEMLIVMLSRKLVEAIYGNELSFEANIDAIMNDYYDKRKLMCADITFNEYNNIKECLLLQKKYVNLMR